MVKTLKNVEIYMPCSAGENIVKIIRHKPFMKYQYDRTGITIEGADILGLESLSCDNIRTGNSMLWDSLTAELHRMLWKKFGFRPISFIRDSDGKFIKNLGRLKLLNQVLQEEKIPYYALGTSMDLRGPREGSYNDAFLFGHSPQAGFVVNEAFDRNLRAAITGS